MRRLVTAALPTFLLALVLALLGSLAPAATAAPVASTAAPTAAPLTYPTPPYDPPGANDWSCRPTLGRPVPVVLVHGTFGDRTHLLERLSATLKLRGFCVYSLDYGNRGTRDIAASAGQLRTFVNRVLTATGAAKVSLVGHSQGGMMPRYYIKFLGGDAVVDDLVGLAPSNHGTSIVFETEHPLAKAGFGWTCEACRQQGTGSQFLRELNAGDETPGDVSYTQITTRYDTVVVPHTSGYLAPGPRTTNLTIQQACPFDTAEHLQIPMSRTAIGWTLDALTRTGPADPALRPC